MLLLSEAGSPTKLNGALPIGGDVRFRFFFAFAGSLIFASAAFGQNWTNPAGGNWATPANWSNDGAPYAPVFNLNSPAPGYTTSLSNSYYFYESQGVAVQNDNVTLDLNSYNITTPELNVATSVGQTGSLTLVGPGAIDLTGSGMGQGSGALAVGTNGGSGQLTVNDATISEYGGENTGAGFNANGLIVENGGQINLQTTANFNVNNATFNDGSLSAPQGLSLTLNSVQLTNGSSIQGPGSAIIYIDNVSLDNSTITSNFEGTIQNTVTLSDNARLQIPDSTISGTLNVLAGASLLSGEMTMQNGTISVQLNGQISDPISRPITNMNDGILDITLQSGFEPAIGEQFNIFSIPQFSPIQTGTFATVNLPALPAGGSWNISDLYTNGTISVVPEPMSMGIMLSGIAGFALRRRRIKQSTSRSMG
jgi:hypothetical protein